MVRSDTAVESAILRRAGGDLPGACQAFLGGPVLPLKVQAPPVA
jgi:hypothetical protein